MNYLGISDVLLNYYSSLDFFNFQIDSKNEIEIQVGGTLQANRGGVGGGRCKRTARFMTLYLYMYTYHLARSQWRACGTRSSAVMV